MNLLNKQITEHISLDDLKCHHCGELLLTDYVYHSIECMENLRVFLGFRIQFNDAHRCPFHNREVGGVSGSEHERIAFDCEPLREATDTDETMKEKFDKMDAAAPGFGFHGIGTYKDENGKDRFRHLDCREYEARWNG